MAALPPEVIIKFDDESRRLLWQLLERMDRLVPLLMKEHAADELVITEDELRAELTRQGHPSCP